MTGPRAVRYRVVVTPPCVANALFASDKGNRDRIKTAFEVLIRVADARHPGMRQGSIDVTVGDPVRIAHDAVIVFARPCRGTTWAVSRTKPSKN
jgi:hypothetical protein